MESLNSISVFTEKNFLVPVKLFDDDSSGACFVNVPILKPKPNKRLWLSDGSLPINRNVSPPELSRENHSRIAQNRALISRLLQRMDFMRS